MIMTFLGAPAGLVFDGLFFQMLDGFVDGRGHVAGLSQSDERSVARADGDLSLVAAFLDGKDDFGLEFVSQDFADFRKARFNVLADGGSYLVVPAGVFHVHERPLIEILLLHYLGTAIWKLVSRSIAIAKT